MPPVRHHARASCAALRAAEESCGSAGASQPRRAGDARGACRCRKAWLHRIAVLCLSALAAACHGLGAADAEAADASLRFPDAQPTLEALGRHALEALARRDSVALGRIRLTEHEHNRVVWPELPASAPELNYPVDYAWTNIGNRNRRGLARLLPMFSGRSVGFQGVECRGPTEEFETFSVHTDCWVVFTADDSSERWEAQLFKDALERGGGYKIFRYYDEEPRPYRGGVLP